MLIYSGTNSKVSETAGVSSRIHINKIIASGIVQLIKQVSSRTLQDQITKSCQDNQRPHPQ